MKQGRRADEIDKHHRELPVASRGHADLAQVLSREVREDPLVDVMSEEGFTCLFQLITFHRALPAVLR
jgi:hypothetical protein